MVRIFVFPISLVFTAYFAEGTADMMDWAASTSYFRSCSVQEPIICSTRHLWNDLPLNLAVRPWNLQAAWPTRERRREGADWWPRRRLRFQYMLSPTTRDTECWSIAQMKFCLALIDDRGHWWEWCACRPSRYQLGRARTLGEAEETRREVWQVEIEQGRISRACRWPVIP